MSPWLRATHLLQHKGSNVVVQMCLYAWLMEFHQHSSCVLFQRDCKKGSLSLYLSGFVTIAIYFFVYFPSPSMGAAQWKWLINSCVCVHVQLC